MFCQAIEIRVHSKEAALDSCFMQCIQRFALRAYYATTTTKLPHLISYIRVFVASLCARLCRSKFYILGFILFKFSWFSMLFTFFTVLNPRIWGNSKQISLQLTCAAANSLLCVFIYSTKATRFAQPQRHMVTSALTTFINFQLSLFWLNFQ